jgi:hypothetical protein
VIDNDIVISFRMHYCNQHRKYLPLLLPDTISAIFDNDTTFFWRNRQTSSMLKIAGCGFDLGKSSPLTLCKKLLNQID